MQLECPNCSVNFKVSPQALGEIGRTVRCSKCAFEWFAEPRDLKEGRRKLPSAPESPPDAVQEPPAMPEAAFSAEALSALDRLNVEEKPVSRPRAGTKEKKKSKLLPAVIVLTVSVLFFVACGLLYFQEALRGMGLGAVYDAIGMEHVEGVKLANLSLTKLNLRRTTYAIEGNVVNTSETAQPIPSLRIRVVDEAGGVLREWSYAQKGVMKPGDVLPFGADKLDCAFLKTARGFVVDIGGSFDLALRD